MLNDLKQAALKYFSIPDSFALTIEDMDEEEATFFWKDEHSEEGYYITLKTNGQLLSLSQPISYSNICISAEQQQEIAEQFMTSQYPDALHYFTLANVQTKPNSIRSLFTNEGAGGIFQ